VFSFKKKLYASFSIVLLISIIFINNTYADNTEKIINKDGFIIKGLFEIDEKIIERYIHL